MAKHQLNNDDKAILKHFNDVFEAILTTVERAKQWKLDDYLVLYTSDHLGNMQVQTNSYGAPVKYKVVHLTNLGIAFVKKTSKKGEPVGRIYSCCGTESDDYRNMTQKFQFELDPDFADSLLLQDEYDPAQLHRSKQDIWKAVTEHNKACKVSTQELKDVVEFFKSVNVGDTLWTSNNGHFLVQDKKTKSPSDFNRVAKWRYQTRMKGPFVTVLTIRDKNGKVREITADAYWQKALYKERPRTYKELNI